MQKNLLEKSNLRLDRVLLSFYLIYKTLYFKSELFQATVIIAHQWFVSLQMCHGWAREHATLIHKSILVCRRVFACTYELEQLKNIDYLMFTTGEQETLILNNATMIFNFVSRASRFHSIHLSLIFIVTIRFCLIHFILYIFLSFWLLNNSCTNFFNFWKSVTCLFNARM